jgi:hypothetical protein
MSADNGYVVSRINEKNDGEDVWGVFHYYASSEDEIPKTLDRAEMAYTNPVIAFIEAVRADRKETYPSEYGVHATDECLRDMERSVLKRGHHPVRKVK